MRSRASTPLPIPGELAVLAAVSGTLWAVFAKWLYPAWGIAARAPMPGRTLAVGAIIWWFMRQRAETWTDFGLGRPRRVWLSVVLGIAFLAVKLTVVQPLADGLARLLEVPRGDPSAFAHLQGNPTALAAWLVIAWVVAGFGEEFIFRGYLMKRLSDLMHGTAAGWGVAVVAQALLFGALHGYLGVGGAISAAVSALAMGAFFFAARRNLWPVVFVHGAWDSLVLIFIYLQGVPG